MARVGLRWGTVAWVGLAASCAFGSAGCADEDTPDTGQDAATDKAPTDSRPDMSVGTDVSADTSVTDQREAGAPDTSADTGAPDGRTDSATPDAMPEGGNNCVGGGDAARDGLAGMALVAQLGCANCHQDEPVDAGLILSGKLTSIVAEAGVYPKNLTPDPATGLGCWTDDQIINAFMNGINEEGGLLCGRMPMYRNRLDGGMPQQVVDFLRTVPAINKAIPETIVCPPRPDPMPEPMPEAGPPDVTDGGAPDGSDGGTPDSGGDTANPPDTGSDGALDAGTDVATPDSGDGASTDVENDGG